MELFPITRRTDMDLELTRDRFDTEQFDKETLERMKKQEMNFNKKENFFNLSYLSVLPLAVIAYLVLKK
jgi:hypothetical protein